jgi:hypothetical protein
LGHEHPEPLARRLDSSHTAESSHGQVNGIPEVMASPETNVR